MYDLSEQFKFLHPFIDGTKFGLQENMWINGIFLKFLKKVLFEATLILKEYIPEGAGVKKQQIANKIFNIYVRDLNYPLLKVSVRW